MSFAVALDLICGTAEATQAQTGTIRIEVVGGTAAIAGVTVAAGGQSGTTDASGIVTLTVPAGRVSVVATKDGYEAATADVAVVAGSEHTVRLVLTAKSTEQSEGTVVASTRTERDVDEQAVRVEMLRRPQIEENLLATPGNMARALDAMAALRLQTTSPELGLAIVRTRGLRGHYTRLLSDGVPLYWDIPGGLAPVQIPPMDLDRVEVITGASALFGANALGGAVNMLSRRPGKERKTEFLISQAAPDATDGVLWTSSPQTGSWGWTLLAGGHRQDEHDADDDGWTDIPKYSRGVARQRVFWDNGRGKSVSGTAGVTFEKREGGSSFARQQLETKIADGALFGEMPLGSYVLAGAASLYVQSRDREFSDVREHERRQAATIEIGLHGTGPRQAWVVGIAADWFANRSPGTPLAGYIAPRGGVFVHDDVRVAPWLLVSGSARLDYNKGAGEVLRVNDFFFSPRGSVLAHKGSWGVRVSADRSYFVPTTLTEETEAAGFARLSIEGPFEIETARSFSADLVYKNAAADLTLTVFHTRVDDPALIDRATYTLRTDPEPLTTRGVEFAGTARRPPFSVTGTYAFIRARERGGRDTALTPRHNARVDAWVGTERGRVGVNVDYTGVQRLERNPYRSTSEPYTLLGVIGEYSIGRFRVFASGQNLTDVRQTDWDPIVRPSLLLGLTPSAGAVEPQIPSRDVDGRWTVDAWAPLAGRVFNVGVRIPF